MSPPTRWRLLVLAGGLAGLAACGSTTAPVVSTSATEDDPSEMLVQTLEAYFPALAAGTAGGVRRAKRAAAPGSPADVFADHQAGMISGAQASSAQQTWQVSSSVIDDNEVDWSTSFANRNSDTAQFTDFVVDSTGRLVTWTIAPDTSLMQALGRIDRSAGLARMTVTVTTGYRTIDGDLQLAYHARTRAQDASVSVKGYVQHGSTRGGITEPYQLEPSPGAVSAGISIFTGSRFGGRLLLSTYSPVPGIAAIAVKPRPWPTATRGSE